jgi:hypothetical protein
MNVGINTLGQEVNLDHPDTASGWYMLPTEEQNVNSDCPQGLRAGVMVIKGAGRINTCNGRIFQENLPDIYLVDYRYKTIIRIVLILTLAMGVFLNIKKIF